MIHQMKNLCVFSELHCVEGPFDATSRGTPELKNRAARDELNNGRGRGWAGPYKNRTKKRDKKDSKNDPKVEQTSPKSFDQGPLKGGGSNGGVSRSALFCPFLSFFVLFCPFLSFLGLFPIFPGFSRFVPGLSGDFPDWSSSSFSAY